MRHLLRAKELTGSRERLSRALKAGMVHRGDPSKQGGPLVVYVILRMYILYQAHASGPRYAQYAAQAIDWPYFEAHTRMIAGKLLDSGIMPEDAFGQARRLLVKTVKSPNTHVHRLRKHSLALTLATHAKTVLGKCVARVRFRALTRAETRKDHHPRPARARGRPGQHARAAGHCYGGGPRGAVSRGDARLCVAHWQRRRPAPEPA